MRAAALDPLARHASSVALRLLAPRPGERIVEVGCGTGALLRELARAVGPSGTAIGMEASAGPAALAEDRVRLVAVGGDSRVIVADVPPIPVPDGSMDAVVLSFVLGSVGSDAGRARLLADCRRVLSRGGRLVCVAMSDRDPRSIVARACRAAHERAPGIVACGPVSAPSLASAAGFAVTDHLDLRVWRLPVDVIRAVPAAARPHD